MKTSNMLKTVLAVAAVGLMAVRANALPILINGPYGQWVNPANEATEYAYFLSAIAAYNAANNPDLPAPGAIDTTPQLIGGATGSGFGNANMPAPTPISITIDFGVEAETYVGLTWDGPNGGTLVYYVGGESGPITFSSPFFPAKNGEKQYGLSHYMFTGPGTKVPDGGLTVGLLGMALGAMGLLMRKIA
jgi:hypothetical protein